MTEHKSYWKGTWSSGTYSSIFANGDVLIKVFGDFNVADLQSCDGCDIYIYTVYKGLYRNGSVSGFNCKIATKDGKIRMSVPYETTGMLSYELEYLGGKLRGTYRLSNPVDSGTVELGPITEHEYENYMASGSTSGYGCTLF